MKRAIRLSLLATIGFCIPSAVLAQGQVPDLRTATLEELLNIEITSASRKEQRAADVAAAVFVITHDDIRRSGMTTVPDLLRLAPGVDVAQINANKWAVSVRGFNQLYANKLLVLVDGRTVYNRLFAGVLWDTEDLVLDDIDRIEVIRGPGAAIWGANAVNAVINIVTKATADTQGVAARVDAGRDGEQGAVRYGGTIGAGTFRLYSQWTGRNQSIVAVDTPANDASHSTTTGFRADWPARAGAFMLEGDFTAGQARALWPNFDPAADLGDQIVNIPSDSQGGHLMGRWTHVRTSGASLQVQSFVDLSGRQEPVGDYHRRVIDIDAQYHTAFGAHQDLVYGAGYRFTDESFDGRNGISLTPADNSLFLATAFLQDEIKLASNRLAITLGSQVQYDSGSGAGVQPTARAVWKGLRRQRIWAATSRALRTPALQDRGVRVVYPPVPSPAGLPLFVVFEGNPATRTETLVDAEAGYRIEIGTVASIDVTGYVGRYDHLLTRETGIPIVQFVPSPRIVVTSLVANELEATTRGLEVAGYWTPVPSWRLDGSYSAFHVTPQLAPGSQDLMAATSDGDAPRAQWQLRTTVSPVTRLTLGAAVFHVGPLEQLQVAAYTRVDINAEWSLARRVSIMVIGQNLLDAAHAEFGGTGSVLLPTQIPRSASVRLRWALR